MSIDSNSGPDDFSSEAGNFWSLLADDVDADVYTAAVRLRRVSRRLGAILNQTVVDGGFSTMGDFQVAALVARSSQSMRLVEVAEKLLVTKAAVTGRVRRLESAGYISRVSDSSDGRAHLLRITRRGRNVTRRTVTAVAAVYDRAFRHLDHDRVVGLSEALDECLRELVVIEAESSPHGT